MKKNKDIYVKTLSTPTFALTGSQKEKRDKKVSKIILRKLWLKTSRYKQHRGFQTRLTQTDSYKNISYLN